MSDRKGQERRPYDSSAVGWKERMVYGLLERNSRYSEVGWGEVHGVEAYGVTLLGVARRRDAHKRLNLPTMVPPFAAGQSRVPLP